MANETSKKPRKVVKGDWSDDETRAKVGTQQVTINDPGKRGVYSYTVVRFDKVTDPAEAMTLLKLKGKRAVRALLRGYNAMVKKDAQELEAQAVARAEARDITIEEARKQLA